MRLTPDQIEAFKTNGFLLIRNFAEPGLCDQIKAKAMAHLAQKIEPIESEEEYLQKESSNTTVRRLRQVYDRDPLFAAWMTNPDIRPVLEQLLGEEPRLLLAHHNSIMTKLPQKSSVTSWHQDIRYWHYENDNLISVWLSLGDEYLENGLLEFIPGSHKMHFTADQFDEQLSFRSDLEQNREIISKLVHYELHKGDIVLFHAKTLHYANENSESTPKISFVYSVRGLSNKPIAGSNSDFKEVVL
jgi:phytanoyl-CoA hydroxylase